MPAPIIQAYYDHLESFSRAFAQEAQLTMQLGQHVTRLVGHLMAGGWVGVGAEHFFREMDDLVLPALGRLSEALQHGGDALQHISSTFKEAEEEAGKLFNGEGGESIFRNPFLRSSKPEAGDIQIETLMTFRGGTPFVTGLKDGDHAVHPNDVRQGGIGNCWMMAPLAALAQNNPSLIENMIWPNDDGTYTVRLYEEKFFGGYEAVDIVVTPEFPEGKLYNEVSESWIPANAHAGVGDRGKDQVEIWPLLIEKAYAQMQGDGDALEGYEEIGSAGGPWNTKDFMSAVTGQPSNTDVVFPSFDDLATLHEEGNLITLATANAPKFLASDYVTSGQLVSAHEYYVTDVDTENRTVTVRNPWGWDEGEVVIPADDLGDAFASLNNNPGGARPE